MKVRKLLPLLFASQLVMFSAAAAGASYQTIYSFAGGTDGEVPVGGVIFGKNGSLYGVTNSGGNDLCGSFLEFSGCGTVFELRPQSDGSWEEDVLHVFNEFLDGGDPAAAVVMDGRGNLYGSTQYYGPFSNGTLWRLTPSGSGWSERILHVFTGGSDGFWCYGLTLSQAHLFGTTYAGGPSDNGEVFELSERPNGKWADKALHYFSGGDRDGDSPSDAIILDAHGNIFGTTYEGGPHIAGTVFEMQYKDGKWKEAPIYFFQGLPFGENFDGTNPTSGVVFDQQGNLYGTTDYGGSKGVGTIYELSPTGTGGWTEKVLYTFMDGKDGGHPSELIIDEEGNLYGVTSGHNTAGSVFEFALEENGERSFKVLYDFTGGADGANPGGRLARDSSGNLYGTAAFGGINNYGVVFEITP